MTIPYQRPLAPRIPKAPKAPVAPRPKAPKAPAPPRVTYGAKPAVTPTSTALGAFRTALAQLNASTPAVDTAGIRAPYVQSEQITGQLGAGYQQAEQQAGAAAQQQYAAGRNDAQQHAAAFGITAGAGANPTALQDTGTPMLASQTAAYQAAPGAATAQWQQLLERTAGAKVADATAQRDAGLTSARQSLATALPGAIGNEEDRAFQRHTQGFNERLAETQLSTKQASDLRSYGLDVAKAKASAGTAAANTTLKQQSLAEKTTNDKANLRVKQDALALKRRSSQATASGLKGIAAATKALSGSTSSAGTKKVAKGWDVQVVTYDKEADATGTKVQTIHVPDKRKIPAGYKAVGSAATHYETVPKSAGSAGMTASQWDVQMRSLLAQNPGRGAEVKRFLGPRPKK